VRIVIGFRALAALAATLVITFTRPDTAALALAIFAGFTVVQGIGSVALGLARRASRPLLNILPPAVISVLAAVGALLALGTAPKYLMDLQVLVMAYLVLNAAFETYLASRVGFKTLEGREHLIAASLAELFALIYVLLNPEPLNAAGFLGAYLALSAVHQGIWAASPSKAD
jgi:uncharacterized membrane protein HdeD (DUF308 family)